MPYRTPSQEMNRRLRIFLQSRHLPLQVPEPRRVLICGDPHGATKYLLTMAKLAKRFSASVVIVLGDFGLSPNGDKFLNVVEATYNSLGIELVAIPGNHDDYDQLYSWPLGPGGFWHPRPHIHIAPKGLTWVWQGRTFGALGGAWSIDSEFRQAHVDLWPDDEELHIFEVDTLAGTPLDVLLTHDAPLSVPLKSGIGITLEPNELVQANKTRRYIDVAISITKPTLLFHGHWHQRHSYTLQLEGVATQVEGLASDYQGDTRTWGLLDLPSLLWTPGNLAGPHKLSGDLPEVS